MKIWKYGENTMTYYKIGWTDNEHTMKNDGNIMKQYDNTMKYYENAMTCNEHAMSDN